MKKKTSERGKDNGRPKPVVSGKDEKGKYCVINGKKCRTDEEVKEEMKKMSYF